MSEYQKGECDCCLRYSTMLKKIDNSWLCPGDFADETIRKLRTRIAELEAENARLKQELADTMTECTSLRKGWAVCHERLVKVCTGMVAIYADPKTYEVSYHLAQEILKELNGGGDE